jgi:hypothetical protein
MPGVEAINEVHVSEPGLVVVDVAAADDETAFAFQAVGGHLGGTHDPRPRTARGAAALLPRHAPAPQRLTQAAPPPRPDRRPTPAGHRAGKARNGTRQRFPRYRPKTGFQRSTLTAQLAPFPGGLLCVHVFPPQPSRPHSPPSFSARRRPPPRLRCRPQTPRTTASITRPACAAGPITRSRRTKPRRRSARTPRSPTHDTHRGPAPTTTASSTGSSRPATRRPPAPHEKRAACARCTSRCRTPAWRVQVSPDSVTGTPRPAAAHVTAAFCGPAQHERCPGTADSFARPVTASAPRVHPQPERRSRSRRHSP